MCNHCDIADNALFSFQLGISSIPFTLMSEIGVDCTPTNLDDNGVSLDSTEGRPLVSFLH